jgi:hypothetical protein
MVNISNNFLYFVKLCFCPFLICLFLHYYRFDHFLEKDPDPVAQVNADLNCLGVKCSVADPDPGSGAFLTPGSGTRDPGWVKNQDPDPG